MPIMNRFGYLDLMLTKSQETMDTLKTKLENQAKQMAKQAEEAANEGATGIFSPENSSTSAAGSLRNDGSILSALI